MVKVIANPKILISIAIHVGNIIPLAKYRIAKGKTTVKLFKAYKNNITIAASIGSLGVYLMIVCTVNGSPVILSININTMHINAIAIKGINFFLFFISSELYAS